MMLGDWSACPSESLGSRHIPVCGCGVAENSAVLNRHCRPSCPPGPAAGCSFPCRGRDLAHFAGAEGCCPLCEAPLAPQDVTKVFDPISHLRRTAFAGLV